MTHPLREKLGALRLKHGNYGGPMGELFDLAYEMAKALETKPTEAVRTSEPDGYAVVLDDKASSPKGYWFAYAYISAEVAEHTAKAFKGRVVPFTFVQSPPAKPTVPQLGITFCAKCYDHEECCEAGKCLTGERP